MIKTKKDSIELERINRIRRMMIRTRELEVAKVQQQIVPKRHCDDIFELPSRNIKRDCMICFKECYYSLYSMPCKHYICSECLSDFVRNEINNGKSEIFCPHQDIKGFCHEKWNWSELREILANFSLEIQTLETRLGENTLNNNNDIRQCPNCLIHVTNKNAVPKVMCPMCNKNFCWKCLQPWSMYNSDDSLSCRNSDCGDKIRIKILETCPIVYLCGASCFTTRACVNCGVLIKYTEKCKHIKCSKCGQGFCFICLRKIIGIEWPCSYETRCALAARQTNIPKLSKVYWGSEEDDDEMYFDAKFL